MYSTTCQWTTWLSSAMSASEKCSKPSFSLCKLVFLNKGCYRWRRKATESRSQGTLRGSAGRRRHWSSLCSWSHMPSEGSEWNNENFAYEYENFASVFPRNKESSVLEQSHQQIHAQSSVLLYHWRSTGFKLQNPAQNDGNHLFQLHKGPVLPSPPFLTTSTFLEVITMPVFCF